MSAQPAQSIVEGEFPPSRIPQVQAMTAKLMIKKLNELLPDSSLISVAIMSSAGVIDSMDYYTKMIVTSTPNGPPAIFIGDSALIPPTSVDALIQAFSLPRNKNYLDQPVRLLKEKDGFGMKINLFENQLAKIMISGPTVDTGKIDDRIFNRYGLISIMNNWTFGTLLFADLGKDND